MRKPFFAMIFLTGCFLFAQKNESFPAIFEEIDSSIEFLELKNLSLDSQKKLFPLLMQQFEKQNLETNRRTIKAISSFDSFSLDLLLNSFESCLKNNPKNTLLGSCIISILEMKGKNSQASLPLLFRALETDLFLSLSEIFQKIDPQSSDAIAFFLEKLNQLSFYEEKLWRANVASISGLFEAQQKELSRALSKALEKETEEYVILAILNALANLGQEESLAIFEKAFSQQNQRVRAMAIKSMRKLTQHLKILSPKTEKYFIQATQEEDKNIRYNGAIALAFLKLRETEVIPILLEAVERAENQYIQADALEGLRVLENKIIVPRLLELLDKVNERTQKRILFILGYLKATESIPKMILLLKHKNQQIAYQAVASLVFIDPSKGS